MRSTEGGVASRIFAAALVFTPRSARRMHGNAACDHFTTELAHVRDASGILAAVGYAIAAILDAIGAGILERASSLARNVTYAFRGARRTPLFSALIVVTMAVAIGANVAIDSVLGRIYLSALPFADPDSLVTVWEHNDTSGFGGNWALTYDDALAIRAQARTLDAAFSVNAGGTMLGVGPARIISGAAVSGNFFETARIRPRLGRALTLDDERGATAAMVVSDRMWHAVFDADPHIIGRVVTVDDRPRTIVGVASPAAYVPNGWQGGIANYDCYFPITSEDRNEGHAFLMIGRIRSGATITAVNADLGRIMDDRGRRYPKTDGGFALRADFAASEVFGSTIAVASAIGGVVFLVLVIACINVANLFLARGSARLGELTIRYSLGATRRDILGQLFTESAVYALVAGIIGLTIAASLFPAMAALVSPTFRYLGPLMVDARTIAVACLCVAVTAVLAGMAPAVVLSRPDLALELKRAGRAGDRGAGARLRSVSVAIEIALTVAVVVISGLTLRTLDMRIHEPLGYVAADRYVANIFVSSTRYGTADASMRLLTALQRRFAAVPGVAEVAATFAVPDGNNPDMPVAVVGRTYPPGTTPEVKINIVGPSYFSVMGSRVLLGRAFTESDRLDTTPVAIVNAAYARATFGSIQAALGKRIVIDFARGGTTVVPRSIVGVVDDIRANVQNDFEPTAYMPSYQMPTTWNSRTFMIHARHGTTLDANRIRDVVREVDPGLPQPSVSALAENVARNLQGIRSADTVLAVLGAIALVLALGGVIGVIAYGVARRMHEIGIRLALGATPHAITLLAARDILVPTVCGVILGIPLAALGVHALDGSLIESSLLSPFEEGALVAFVVVCVALAAYVPARRAARIDPLVALRYE
jgi:predicted permease